MAEMIIQNPSITPNVFEYDEAGRVSAISGYPLAGGGGGTIVKSDLMWKPDVGSDGYVHWTLASSATSPAPAYISGAQGPAGPQGVSGNPGKNPEFQINSENAHWEWRYSGDASWTDLGVVASGAVGPQGLSGDDGEDGISPKVRINNSTNFWEISEDDGKTWTSTNVSATGPAGEDGIDGTNGVSPTVSTSAIPGGNRVIFTYDNGGTTATESIDVMSGASGAPGANGVSPTVTITDAPTAAQHPQGGKTVTITDADHPTGQSFDIWNGINGEGATVNLLDGNGIHITNDGTNYTIAVSADYAAKSYVDSASANALNEAKSWVESKHYLTEVPNTYALKTDVEAASANAYDKAVAQIPNVSNFITKDVNDLTYYYQKTETSGATELSTEFAKYVTKPDSSLVNKYLVLRTDNAGNVSGWCDFQDQSYSKSEANGTFVATANIDTTTLSGDGKSVSTKLGVKTDVIATKDYVNNSFLPLTGGTVSGQLIVSATSGNFDTQYLKLIREGVAGYGRIGLGSNGPLALKVDDANSHTTQINISPNATNDQLVQVQHGGTTSYLIPAQIHQGSYTPTTADGILHIILES